MLKALEILKTINRRYCTDNVCGKLDLAIAELEALENRSCNNCLYFSNSGRVFGLCSKGISSDFKIGTFCCNKWESK